MNISKILEWFSLLESRPQMIIAGKNLDYRLLKTYIEGYIDGLSHAVDKNLSREITNWFQKKIDEKTSLYWTDHIPYCYKSKTEDELKKLLIQITKEYFMSLNNTPPRTS